MDSFFEKAKAFAEEAAKRSQDLASQTAKYSQELAQETAKYSQELTKGNVLQDLAKKSQQMAQEAAKRSQEFASEAATKLPELAQKAAISTEASLNQLVKDLKGPSAAELAAATGNVEVSSTNGVVDEEELLYYGITDELREFVRGLTIDTFKEFPVPDEEIATASKKKETPAPEPAVVGSSEISVEPSGADDKTEGGADAPPKSPAAGTNVRKDLSDWQAKHAILVLQSVPEINTFRYKLCPGSMKEQRFWRVYFLLVHSHVKPYEEKAAKEPRPAVATKKAGAAATSQPGAPEQPVFGLAKAFSAAAAQAAAAAAAAASSITTMGKAGAQESGAASTEESAGSKAAASTSGAPKVGAAAVAGAAAGAAAAAGTSSSKVADSSDVDIDALLNEMGDDGDDDGDDDDAFDAEEFDDLVNSALEDDDAAGH